MEHHPPAGPASEPRPADHRLESWKEIASYLKRDVTTVQRWEKREGMPVYRHLHDKSSSVYALRTELEAWARSRASRASVPIAAGAEGAAAGARSAARRRIGVRSATVVVLALALVSTAATWFARRSHAAWSSPLDGARITFVTHFEGSEHDAALSADGRLVAFLSDRDGQTDVWTTRLGTGQFTNVTQGRVPNLVNPAVRSIGFSPDGRLVTFWTRQAGADTPSGIATWAVPVDGGDLRSYLDRTAEFDWSDDGARLVYHTPGPGDPTYVREGGETVDRLIYTAPQGLHAHFPSWSPHDRFIYFVQGSVAEAMDLWRIPPVGGAPERITHHDSRVSHPVMLDEKNVLYLATDRDGGGPWIHLVDVERRAVHRLNTGVETYTSLSASADGRKIAATLTHPRETLWRLDISGSSLADTAPVRIALPTGRGTSPRLGPGYLVYVVRTDDSDAIWRMTGSAATPLWSEPRTRILGAPAIAPNGERVAFCAEREGRTRLIVVAADGSQPRILTDSLALHGTPAWTPDGRSITVGAASDGRSARLFTLSLDGGSSGPSPGEYALDPAWSPDGRFVVYSGPDVGTRFRVKAARPDGTPQPLPDITLTRGARSLRFLPGRRALVVLRGEILHKDLWAIDLDTGAERRLTRLPADFHVRDFDISPNGRELVLDRVQDQSDIVLMDLARR